VSIFYRPRPGRFICGGTPVLRQLDREQWELTEPVCYETNDGHKLMVPAGFLTDLASLPPVTEAVLGRSPAWDAPALLHDYAYRHGAVREAVAPHYTVERPVSRKEADQLFADAIVSNDTHPTGSVGLAVLMYYALRWFGGGQWAKARRAAA